MYNPYDMNNAQDQVEAQIEARRLKRDGFVTRPISREIAEIDRQTAKIRETRLELVLELKEIDGAS